VSVSLNIKDIEKYYDSVKALKSISLSIESGRIILLLGINGAGKTTLMRIMAGLEKPDKGTLLVNNESKSAQELRQIATMVFQRTAMFNMSVYDNLAFGLRIRGFEEQRIAEKVSQALDSVGLANFEKRKAKKLSGGEQQRIALARAFLINPRIILLDEPTSNLDPYNAMIIEKTIRSIREENRIIIMATHNIIQAKKLADEVIHIHDGKILEMSNTEDFFSKPKHELSLKFIKGELSF